MSAARATWVTLLTLLLASCGSSDSEPQAPPARLVRRPVDVDDASQLSPDDDYWTRRYGALMTSSELRAHWSLARDERFERRAHRLLELRLRDQLLARSGLTLSPEELDAYAAQPDLDACRNYLDAKLGAPSSSPPEDR